MKKWVRFASVALAAACVGSAFAQLTLSDGGYDFVLDNDTASPFFGGAFDWIDPSGTDSLSAQLYFVRFGQQAEVALGQLNNLQWDKPLDNMARFWATGGGLDFQVTYLLTGSDQVSDIAEVIKIRNSSSDTVRFSFFQFDDFDLAGDTQDDTAEALNSSTIFQQDGNYSVTVGTVPIPTAYEVNDFGALFGSLTDANPTTLDSNNDRFGPGDIAFAFQWDVSLAPGQSWVMSKNKILAVPEPASMLAVGAGVAFLIGRRRRK